MVRKTSPSRSRRGTAKQGHRRPGEDRGRATTKIKPYPPLHIGLDLYYSYWYGIDTDNHGKNKFKEVENECYENFDQRKICSACYA